MPSPAVFWQEIVFSIDSVSDFIMVIRLKPKQNLEESKLTEIVNAEPVIIAPEAAVTKENIVERKTIVYEAHIDPTVIRVSGEKLKQQLYTKLGLFRPRSEEIQFVSLDKYYEPYIVISGKYFIDYYRKCAYVFRVDEAVKEVVLLKNTFVPEPSKSHRSGRIIKLPGEERLVNEAKAFLILDKNGRDAAVDNLPSAPSEKRPERVIEECGIQEIPEKADVDFVRGRIAKRPEDISRIVEEVFEISDRSVIYTPRFRLLFRNVRTGEERVLVIDGVTSKRI
jgi:hypothetical protein